MSANSDGSHGIRILSLDSGGPGTYSQLLILKEYASRLATDLGISEDDVYLADYFDLMGGVGFGGLAVLLLGHLRLNLNDAIDTLLEVATAVFPEESQQTIDRDRNTKELKKAVESILEARDISLNTKMNDPQCASTNCKVTLYAATSVRINHPQAFRTYPSRGSNLNPTIVEAICATIVAPSHFSPVKIGPRLRQQAFIGGAVGANNATRELLKEASNVFGYESRVAQIISIGSGIHPVLSMNLEMTEATRLLKEIATDCEAVAQELHTRLYRIKAYLRLNVERGMEGITIGDWSELGAIESHTGAYIVVASVSKSVDISLRQLRERIGTVTLGQVNQSRDIKVTAKTAPAVSPHFVPRAALWAKMIYHLVSSDFSRQRIFPITGMGGCGKTQMVSYFLQENPSIYTRVAFVDASSSYSAQSDLQAWAQALGDGHEHDMWEDAIRLLLNVPLVERWLLVLDNADDPKLNLVPFIPKCRNLTIIITSRNRGLGNLSTTHHLELGEMEADEALATLLRAARREVVLSNEDMKAAKTLIKELGYLAVAVVQAGTYCHQLSSQTHGILYSYTFTKYLELFFTHRAELMKKAQPSPLDNYERGVYTTLDLSYQAIPQLAREFLHFISFFHHTNIPLTAMATAATNRFADPHSLLPRPDDHGRVIADLERLLCAEGKWSELQVQEAIQGLRSFSLISATPTSDDLFLQIHPLIQAWSRDTVSTTSSRYKAMAMKALTSCSGDEAPQVNRWILPHVLEILGQINVEDIHVNDLVAIGEVLRDQGHYRRAAGLVEAALEKMRGSGDQGVVETLTVSALLAALYWDDGRLVEAEKLEVDVLEQRGKILGVEHPDTIKAAANLAATYHSQGRWGEAEKLEIDVLEQRGRVLGVEHLDTILAAANLAGTYRSQGRWNDAEKLEVGVLEQRRRILGMEHPDTIVAAANLAGTYQEQDQWSEAERLEVDVLEQRRRILGVEHPDTILATACLAATYRSQGRLGECVELLGPAVKLSVKVLGQQHPWMQRFAEMLVYVYEDLDRHDDAEETRALLL